MDLSVRTEQVDVPVDRSWVGSKHGTDELRSITLDLSKFVKATHYPAGVIKSGTVVVEITASPGTFGPYDTGATDGRQTPTKDNVVHLWNNCPVATGREAAKVGASGLEHGVVLTSKLPANSGYATAIKTASTLIRYR